MLASRSLQLQRCPAKARSGRLLRQPLSVRAALPSVSVEDGKLLLDRESYKFVDLRSAVAYEQEHLTKPPRSSVSVPWGPGSDGGGFVGRLSASLPGKGTKMLLACEDGGQASQRAQELLAAEGYSSTLRVEGGYEAWTKVFSTSGRRRPPPGRWVSSGKEALKSGLNIPGVAESYDEGGNLITARWAKGFREGGGLPPSS